MNNNKIEINMCLDDFDDLLDTSYFILDTSYTSYACSNTSESDGL